VKDDIAAGLKNAMERGDSLERAMQSFINAGYNPNEVRAAGNLVSQGASQIAYPSEDEKRPEESGRQSEENIKHSLPEAPRKKERKEGNGKRVLLIGVIILGILIFLGAIGYLVYTLMSE